ncbi:MAG: PTS sugar transporter subunit IIC [Thermodesulfobacteriota bacterium]
MTGLVADAFVVSLAGGAISLDRTAALQTMVSRPMVTAPVIGFLLGSTGAGLAVGVVLELLLMGDLPVGAYVPVHDTSLSAAVTAVTVALTGGGGEILPAFPVALLATVPVAIVYRRADNLTRGFNARLFRAAEAGLGAGGTGGAAARAPGSGLMAVNLRGLAAVFISTSVTLFVTVLLMLLAVSLSPWKAPAAGGPGGAGPMSAAFAGCALLGIGAGVAAVSDGPRSFTVFTASLAATAILMVVLVW